MRDDFDTGRRPWLYGLAALATTAVIAVGGIWLTTRGQDEGAPSGGEGSSGVHASPPSSGPSPASTYSPPAWADLPADHPGRQLAQAEAEHHDDDGHGQDSTPDGETTPPTEPATPDTPAPAVTDEARAKAIDAQAVTVGEQAVRALLDWSVEARDGDPFGAALTSLMVRGPVDDDAQVVVVPKAALTAISRDAIGHLAMPKVLAVRDVTNRDINPAGSGQVVLVAEVVFVNDAGWTRPGLRLTVDLQVTDSLVTWLVINDGYVEEDPELRP